MALPRLDDFGRRHRIGDVHLNGPVHVHPTGHVLAEVHGGRRWVEQVSTARRDRVKVKV